MNNKCIKDMKDKEYIETLREKLSTFSFIKERCQNIKKYLKKKLRKPTLQTNEQVEFSSNQLKHYLNNKQPIMSEDFDNFRKNRKNILKKILENEKINNNTTVNSELYLTSLDGYLHKYLNPDSMFWIEIAQDLSIERYLCFNLWLNEVLFSSEKKTKKQKVCKNTINKLLQLGYGWIEIGVLYDIQPTQLFKYYIISNQEAPESKKRWTIEEDQNLKNAVEVFGERWKLISKKLKNRTSLQCRDRYKNYISPDINRSEWTEEEDKNLIELVDIHGKKWSKISTLITKRNDKQCRKRYHKLTRLNN